MILVAWLFAESARHPEMPANHCARTPAGRGRRSGDAARFRTDHAGRAGLERAVLPGRHADGMESSASEERLSSGWRAPHAHSARARRIERFRDPTSGDTFNIDQAIESFQRGAGSGAVRARERSSAFCRRAIPTSCSRSPPRSSASRSAWCWWSCSCSSCCAPCATRSGSRILRALRGGRPRDPVRIAVGDQHGGLVNCTSCRPRA